MTDIWIHQTREYGLGNFINLTPTLQLMADHLKKPVPVYFDLSFIEACFFDCPFIEILEEMPKHNPSFTSGLINGRNSCPDYIHVYKEITKAIPLSGELPHTYVDQAKEIIGLTGTSYTLFIRGSGSENKIYLNSKMPRDEYYHEYFNANLTGNYDQNFTGSQ